MFRLRWGRPAWAVPVLLFLAVLIVAALAFNLANLDTGGEAVPDVPDAGGTPPTTVGDVVPGPLADLVLFGLVGGLVFGLIAIGLRKRVRVPRQAKPTTWWEVLSSFVGIAFVIALILVWPRILAGLQGGADSSNTTASGSGGDSPLWPTAAGTSAGIFLAVTVFAAILVLAYFLRRGAGAFRAEAKEPLEAPRERWVAAKAVQSAIDELELGGDVRTVILACYRRFCGLLGSRGIGDQAALTPREIEGLAVERLRVSPNATETLTSLFEEARYSEHPLGEGDRGRAIDSLARIRTALEG